MKMVFIHLTGAIITGVIGLSVIKYGQEVFSNKLDSHEILLLLFVVAIFLYFIMQLTHSILSYLWFFCTKERGMCGLFIEAYMNDKGHPRLSLMVVYFDVREEELKIVGYAYGQDEKNITRLAPIASWESRALHHTEGKDNFEIFYIHEGDVGKHTKVRGTTICRLPASASLPGHGHFCDLQAMDETDLKSQYFEVIRAQAPHQREFFNGLKGPMTRFWYFLKLGAPEGQQFLAFALSKGCSLLEEEPGTYRGTIMSKVCEILRKS